MKKARASLLRHCWTLGLRCPSEGSFGMFATMLLMTDPSKPTFSAFQKYSLIAEIKKEFRKLKTVQRSDDFSYTEYLESLPSNFETLPPEYQLSAFPDGPPGFIYIFGIGAYLFTRSLTRLPCKMFFTYAHSLSGLQKDDLLIAVGSTKLRLPKEMQVTKDKSDDVSSGPMKDVRQLMEFAFRMGQGLHGSSQSDASSSRTPVQPLLALENGSVDSKDIEHLVVLVISCFSIYLGREIFCMYVYFERYSIVSLVQDTGDSQASALEHMDLKAKGADESPDPEALQVVPAAPDTSAKQSDTAPPAAAEPAPTAESQPVEPDAMSRLQVAMTQRKSLSVEPASKSASAPRQLRIYTVVTED